MVRTTLSDSSRRHLETFFEVATRYQHLPPYKMLPWAGVRCLCIRRGYEGVVFGMRTWSEDAVVNWVLDDLEQIGRLWTIWNSEQEMPAIQRGFLTGSIQRLMKIKGDSLCRKAVFKILMRMQIRESYMRSKGARWALH